MIGIEMDKYVTVGEIASNFHLEQITGDEESLKRKVSEPDVNRPGFELTGYVRSSDPLRVVLMGNKEIEYMEQMPEDVQWPRYRKIIQDITPMIIICQDKECPKILYEVAKENNFPIFRSPGETYRLTVDLISFLDEKLAPEDTLYGVLMVVFGKGVLLTGNSGIGKSETALELLQSGQSLVSDDRVDILRVHNQIVGTSPNVLRGMLEVRGIGVVDIERMYGATSIIRKHQIDMVVHLREFDEKEEYDRLGELPTRYTNLLDVQIPTIKLPVSPGRSTSVLVESAVMNFILNEEGYNNSNTFKERIEKQLEENKRKKNEG